MGVYECKSSPGAIAFRLSDFDECFQLVGVRRMLHDEDGEKSLFNTDILKRSNHILGRKNATQESRREQKTKETLAEFDSVIEVAFLAKEEPSGGIPKTTTAALFVGVLCVLPFF